MDGWMDGWMDGFPGQKGQDQELESSVNKFAHTARRQARASTQVISQDQHESLRNYDLFRISPVSVWFCFLLCFPYLFPPTASLSCFFPDVCLWAWFATGLCFILVPDCSVSTSDSLAFFPCDLSHDFFFFYLQRLFQMSLFGAVCRFIWRLSAHALLFVISLYRSIEFKKKWCYNCINSS